MGRTGYAPLPADVPDDVEPPVPFSPKPSSRPARASRPSATALHVDELFQRWTRTIADRIKKKSSGARRDLIPQGPTPVDIIASVLSSDSLRSTGRSAKGKEKEHEPDQTRTLDHEEPMAREAFDRCAPLSHHTLGTLVADVGRSRAVLSSEFSLLSTMEYTPA